MSKQQQTAHKSYSNINRPTSRATGKAFECRTKYRYDPFGNTITSSGTSAGANVYRFSSKYYSSTLKMYYYLYRWYDPNLQRWINRDPLEESGGLNLYRLVGNNPLSFTDLFGLAYGNPIPPCFPYPACLNLPKPPSNPGKWDDGYSDCWAKCMMGLTTAAHVGMEMGGAERAAGVYYHFTDGRFTAWGTCSKVLVPRFAKRISPIGWLASAGDAIDCAEKCWKETSGADPDPPPPPPPYPVGWPGRGQNVPPPFPK